MSLDLLDLPIVPRAAVDPLNGWEEIAPILLIASCAAFAFVVSGFASDGNCDMHAQMSFGSFPGLGMVACWLAVG
jgi:hypothetical protein